MSELKAYKGDIYIPVYGSITDAKVYLKSEADKVIAHNKYKRCLAMARWCRSRACFYDTMREDGPYWSVKSDRAYRWYKWWFKTAVQFKEEK